jgi:hypothetical protein
LRIAWFYYTDRRVVRDIRYGAAPRNRLDLYMPAGPRAAPATGPLHTLISSILFEE